MWRWRTKTRWPVAGEAIRSVWYQKWWVHLRHRPESGGGIVHLLKSRGHIDGNISNTVLSSKAVQASHAANNNSWFLSQAFPEGSPTHPVISDGARRCCRGLHNGAQILFQRLPDFAESGCSDKRWHRNSHLYGTKRRLVDGQRRDSQVGKQHKLRPRYPRRYPLAKRYNHLNSARRGGRAELPEDGARCYDEEFSISLTKLDGTTYTIANP